MKINSTITAILQTLLYSDIFNFPLSQEELWRFLLTEESIKEASFIATLQTLPSKIVFKDGYYCLAGREALIEQRKHYQGEAVKKLKIARSAAYNLSYIPTISFIGISGSVALGNVSPTDDIDLFIITKKKSLFLTRLWVLAVLELMGVRRKRNETNAADKVCVNLMIDESKLQWPLQKRDVYVAHEIAQVVPLFERKGIYSAFLQSNEWIAKFLPNSTQTYQKMIGNSWQRKYYSLDIFSKLVDISLFGGFVKAVQKAHMRRYKTTETITDTFLAFHPYDYRTRTLQLLQQKYADFGLLTKI